MMDIFIRVKQHWVLKPLSVWQDVLKYVTLRWSILKGSYVLIITSGLPRLAKRERLVRVLDL